MSWLRIILLAILASIMQASLLGSLRFGAVLPGLVLVALVCVASLRTASETLLFAVVAGAILDQLAGGMPGLAISSLVFMAAVLIALRQRGIDGRGLAHRLSLVAGASVVWGLIHMLATPSATIVSLAAWRILIGEVLINNLLMIVLGPLIDWWVGSENKV